MPNYVRNIVQMEGVAALPLFTEKDGALEFDFNKLIPMPESLNVEAGSLEDVAIEAVIRRIAPRRYPFQKAQAVPVVTDDEFTNRAANLAMSGDELCKRGLQYISNKVLYGVTTWYDWCCENWGTKWNAHNTKFSSEKMLIFSTAWSPPIQVVTALAQMYPQAVVEHWWADEDVGSNTGYAKYSQGKAETVNFYTDGSNEAYDTYVFCWGESTCLDKDKDGVWYHKNCDQCHGCD